MKNWQRVREANKIFDSITCLCAEGVEFMDKLQLADAIVKEAMKGYELTKKPEKD